MEPRLYVPCVTCMD